MLSIIPKEVLANLNNIHKLLDIGQNLAKNTKNNMNNKKNKRISFEQISKLKIYDKYNNKPK